MALLQTQALVLQTKNSGDADRLVSFLSADSGVIHLFARQVRRTKSPMGGSVQPFAFLDITYDSGSSRSLRQCSVIESFQKLREDLTAMAYAAVITELVAAFWPEGEGDAALLEAVLDMLRLAEVRNPRLVALAAGWQLLARAGFAPELAACVQCGAKVTPDYQFSAALGGIVCPSCATAEALVLSQPVYDLLLRLFTLDFASPGHFTVRGNELISLEKVFLDYLLCHLERPLKSLAFIHSIA